MLFAIASMRILFFQWKKIVCWRCFPCACMKTRVTFYKDAQQLTVEYTIHRLCFCSQNGNTNNWLIHVMAAIGYWIVCCLVAATQCVSVGMYVINSSHGNSITFKQSRMYVYTAYRHYGLCICVFVFICVSVERSMHAHDPYALSV